MLKAPLPPNEAVRLEALRGHRLLDTAGEVAFDDFTFLASFLCEAPIALVSLVDADRQWFKSRRGLEARQTPRDQAFCAHAILGTDLFVVADAAQDVRFADNPLVTGDPNIRFYAGAPLVDGDGFALGTLCVIDRHARALSDKQSEALQALARQVMCLIEQRRSAAKLAAALEEVRTLSGLIPVCSGCKSVRNDAGYWEAIETYIASRTETSFSHGICPDCLRRLYPEQAEQILSKQRPAVP